MWKSGYLRKTVYIQEGTEKARGREKKWMCIGEFVEKAMWIMVINKICKPDEKENVRNVYNVENRIHMSKPVEK